MRSSQKVELVAQASSSDWLSLGTADLGDADAVDDALDDTLLPTIATTLVCLYSCL